MAETMTALQLPDAITVRDLAAMMGVSPINIIKELMKSGIMATINQQIDFDTASIVAEELGFEVLAPEDIRTEEEEIALEELPEWRQTLAQESRRSLSPRAPVVTIMGHVDHGKTSLLDVIRRANVADGEAGGITQHIAAYQAEHEGELITFLDTPGHAAFTQMRARGAHVTDIAVLVVAADDGLMPQSIEAIDHAQAAHVPIVVAINKIDLASANIPRTKQMLADKGLIPIEWDGDTEMVEVSAKEEYGIDDLLETILFTAEEITPRANPKAKSTGAVIEARMERGKGATATLLVQNGTLKRGDTLLIGTNYGRIKAMYDFKGKQIKQAGPSTPVLVSGLNGLPSAGDTYTIVKNEKTARKIVAGLEAEIANSANMKGPSLEDFFRQMQSEDIKTLSLIIKTDVQGSVEPIVSTLNDIQHEEVKIRVMRAAAGNVTESDVMLASASGAYILAFNTHIDAAAERAAASERVDIRKYSIIYKLFEDVESAIEGMLDPIYELKIVGRAEVRQLFRIRGVGTIAGCFMRTGVAKRKAVARVIRGNKFLYEGPVWHLKHHSEDVQEIRTGFEFGVSVRDWDRFRPNDLIEFFVEERVR